MNTLSGINFPALVTEDVVPSGISKAGNVQIFFHFSVY